VQAVGFSPMILIEFLLADTVPSAPRPKKTARSCCAARASNCVRKSGSKAGDKLRHIVVDADREAARVPRAGAIDGSAPRTPRA
jgi:hypothetical protein